MAGGGWSSLPADLLQQVCSRLTSEDDVLHVRQVCPHWRACTSLPVAPFRPWVVATRAKPIRVGPLGEYSLWLPRGLKRVQLASPPGLPYCCGTPRGWLALADDERSPTRLVLWEPRSGTEIQLPPLACVVQGGRTVISAAKAPAPFSEAEAVTRSRMEGKKSAAVLAASLLIVLLLLSGQPPPVSGQARRVHEPEPDPGCFDRCYSSCREKEHKVQVRVQSQVQFLRLRPRPPRERGGGGCCLSVRRRGFRGFCRLRRGSDDRRRQCDGSRTGRRRRCGVHGYTGYGNRMVKAKRV